MSVKLLKGIAMRLTCRTFMKVVFFVLSLTGSISHGYCQSTSDLPDEEFPQQGVLAVSGRIPAPNSLDLPLPPGLAPGKTPPITGGLSQKDGTKWSYSLTNNFPQKISINLEIRQYDASLKNVTSSRVSHRLKSGESVEGDFITAKKTVGCALVMTNWKLMK